ncbi:hypothetical protein DM01DRAFT_1338983 [Hesseltinella vesiculosa]|uniref:Adhesin domain-containing protein n=1 Tax=Hesseltinella vesiculosa TaxID=101127 RepID=A0A1X2G8H7_9FUNG|nr:hypothetical protein DM01DRAFT_1338983 [Hesseltinella vesiculosa]
MDDAHIAPAGVLPANPSTGTKHQDNAASLPTASNSPPAPSAPPSLSQQQQSDPRTPTAYDWHQDDMHDTSDLKNAIIERRETNEEIRWQGPLLRARRVHLRTTNSKLQLQGNMEAWKSVDLETTNGKIAWTGDYIKARRVNIQTSNSNIELQGKIAARDIRICTSNSKILGEKCYVVGGPDGRVEITSSNGKIHVPHMFNIDDELVVKTSSASVELGVHSNRPHLMDVRVQTSHSKIVLNMPAAFAGNFKLITSSRNQVIIEDPQGAIQYDNTVLDARQGTRFQGGKGQLRVVNKDGDIYVNFTM